MLVFYICEATNAAKSNPFRRWVLRSINPLDELPMVSTSFSNPHHLDSLRWSQGSVVLFFVILFRLLFLLTQYFSVLAILLDVSIRYLNQIGLNWLFDLCFVKSLWYCRWRFQLRYRYEGEVLFYTMNSFKLVITFPKRETIWWPIVLRCPRLW